MRSGILGAVRDWLARPLAEGESDRHRLIAAVSLREMRSRLPVFLFLALPSLFLWSGAPAALACALVVLAAEAAEALRLPGIARGTGPLRGADRLWMYASSLVSAAGYALPGLVLAAHPSPPVAMIGILWLAGMVIHVSTQYVAVRFFHLSSLAIACAALLLAALAVGLAPPRPATELERAAGLVWALVFIVHLWAMFLGVRQTQAALDRAQDAERARLAELAHVTAHDGLTGLANRGEMERRLAAALAGPERAGLGLLVLDLDGFKPVNDGYGHAAGDAVLRATAERLRAAAPEGAFAARLGGDEFALVVPGLGGREQARALALRLAAEVERHVPWEGTGLSVGASIGVALAADVTGGAGDLVAAADWAMYRAKEARAGHVHLFLPEEVPLRPTREDRAALEAAIRRGEIVPFFQPKIELATGGIAGFEALARWRHPARGLLLPRDFLPLATEFALVPDLTYAMARQVLVHMRDWFAEGLDPGRVSINVTEATLATRSGIEDFEWLLAEFPGTAGHLAIEVTESVIVARSASTIRAHVDRLSLLGVRVAMDDFGRGLASFRQLRHFTFHEIKIDGEFVAGLGRDPAAAVVIDGFLAIARGLRADVVAEGIETAEQAEELRARGCRYGQGFLFGVPADAEATRTLLRAARRRPELIA